MTTIELGDLGGSTPRLGFLRCSRRSEPCPGSVAASAGRVGRRPRLRARSPLPGAVLRIHRAYLTWMVVGAGPPTCRRITIPRSPTAGQVGGFGDGRPGDDSGSARLARSANLLPHTVTGPSDARRRVGCGAAQEFPTVSVGRPGPVQLPLRTCAGVSASTPRRATP